MVAHLAYLEEATNLALASRQLSHNPREPHTIPFRRHKLRPHSNNTTTTQSCTASISVVHNFFNMSQQPSRSSAASSAVVGMPQQEGLYILIFVPSVEFVRAALGSEATAFETMPQGLLKMYGTKLKNVAISSSKAYVATMGRDDEGDDDSPEDMAPLVLGAVGEAVRDRNVAEVHAFGATIFRDMGSLLADLKSSSAASSSSPAGKPAASDQAESSKAKFNDRQNQMRIDKLEQELLKVRQQLQTVRDERDRLHDGWARDKAKLKDSSAAERRLRLELEGTREQLEAAQAASVAAATVEVNGDGAGQVHDGQQLQLMMAEIRAKNARLRNDNLGLRNDNLGLRVDKRQLERDKLASDKTTVAQLKEWLRTAAPNKLGKLSDSAKKDVVQNLVLEVFDEQNPIPTLEPDPHEGRMAEPDVAGEAAEAE